jgi:hypothetical protein
MAQNRVVLSTWRERLGYAFRTADFEPLVIAAHNASREFILFERFQIALPRGLKAIILRVIWRLPGGRPVTQK